MFRFKSTVKSYTVFVTLDDNTSRKVSFSQFSNMQNYGMYYCHNDKIAEGIRKLPTFGSIITEIEEKAKDVQASNVRQYQATYPDVRRTQEANKVLVNKYGVDETTLRTKADAVAAAEKLNICFPNL